VGKIFEASPERLGMAIQQGKGKGLLASLMGGALCARASKVLETLKKRNDLKDLERTRKAQLRETDEEKRRKKRPGKKKDYAKKKERHSNSATPDSYTRE